LRRRVAHALRAALDRSAGVLFAFALLAASERALALERDSTVVVAIFNFSLLTYGCTSLATEGGTVNSPSLPFALIGRPKRSGLLSTQEN